MVAAASAAEQQGVRAMCGFNYRRVPAVALMRRLVAEGRIGRVRHVRAAYLQDWIVDPSFPLVWRLRKEIAGSGALGDIGAHIVDLAQFLTGQLVTGVSAFVWTPLYAFTIVALLFWLSYRRIARIFKWLTLVLFAYVLTAFMAGADWGAVLRSTFLPQVEWSRAFLAVFVGILGTTILAILRRFTINRPEGPKTGAKTR